jgi:hypothetical protein
MFYGSLVFGGVSHRDHREKEFSELFSKVSVRSVAMEPHLIPKSLFYQSFIRILTILLTFPSGLSIIELALRMIEC